jgi:hypothetical protein
MFRLYYAPGTCALATHIALEEAGAPYQVAEVLCGRWIPFFRLTAIWWSRAFASRSVLNVSVLYILAS